MSTSSSRSQSAKNVRKESEETANKRYQRLDHDTNRLIEIFGQMIQLSQLSDKTTGISNEKEALQLAIYASEFLTCCEGLLQLCSELKQSYLLHNFQLLQQLNEKNWEENQSKEEKILKALFKLDDKKMNTFDKQQAFTELQSFIDLANLKRLHAENKTTTATTTTITADNVTVDHKHDSY